jgi:hypothetical protein
MARDWAWLNEIIGPVDEDFARGAGELPASAGMARPLALESAVRSQKQIPRGAPKQIRDPPLCHVVRAIVDQMATLTQAAQVAHSVVGRIVIEVGGGEHDARRPQPRHLLEVGPAGGAAASVAPRLLSWIVPSAVRQAPYGGAVRPPAALAHAPGAIEADAPTELAPVRGIEIAKLSPNRHEFSVLSSLKIKDRVDVSVG